MLRRNLYSQKSKTKPIKPIYILDKKTRRSTLRILNKYSISENTLNGYYDSIEDGLKNDFLENYQWKELPEVKLYSEERSATMREFVELDSLSNKNQFLDIIQIFIDYATNKEDYIESINILFELNNFGYRILNDTEISKIPSEEIFNKAEEVFNLAKKIGLENAREELEESFKFYHADKKGLAIKFALDSVDTVMKFIVINDEIINDKDIKDQKGNTKALLERLKKSNYFSCPGDVPIQNGIEHILASMRNKIPGAGHSKGTNNAEIDDELTELAIGLSATYSSFLIK